MTKILYVKLIYFCDNLKILLFRILFLSLFLKSELVIMLSLEKLFFAAVLFLNNEGLIVVTAVNCDNCLDYYYETLNYYCYPSMLLSRRKCRNSSSSRNFSSSSSNISSMKADQSVQSYPPSRHLTAAARNIRGRQIETPPDEGLFTKRVTPNSISSIDEDNIATPIVTYK